ncbi:gp90 [Erwinia phage vB_EamM-Y2]|uniref:Gp90 n=1 Tax=Erwinia phage vB_EamM-Y2 TaxID=1051676 RepID=G0YQ39_9CAUD|nr:gp90 [Erwinia phage vB_EamM-Y2]AEJ81466.1 gp90 [Erwinia phage vB_EamM-Y2]
MQGRGGRASEHFFRAYKNNISSYIQFQILSQY